MMEEFCETINDMKYSYSMNDNNGYYIQIDDSDGSEVCWKTLKNVTLAQCRNIVRNPDDLKEVYRIANTRNKKT